MSVSTLIVVVAIPRVYIMQAYPSTEYCAALPTPPSSFPARRTTVVADSDQTCAGRASGSCRVDGLCDFGLAEGP